MTIDLDYFEDQLLQLKRQLANELDDDSSSTIVENDSSHYRNGNLSNQSCTCYQSATDFNFSQASDISEQSFLKPSEHYPTKYVRGFESNVGEFKKSTEKSMIPSFTSQINEAESIDLENKKLGTKSIELVDDNFQLPNIPMRQAKLTVDFDDKTLHCSKDFCKETLDVEIKYSSPTKTLQSQLQDICGNIDHVELKSSNSLAITLDPVKSTLFLEKSKSNNYDAYNEKNYALSDNYLDLSSKVVGLIDDVKSLSKTSRSLLEHSISRENNNNESAEIAHKVFPCFGNPLATTGSSSVCKQSSTNENQNYQFVENEGNESFEIPFMAPHEVHEAIKEIEIVSLEFAVVLQKFNNVLKKYQINDDKTKSQRLKNNDCNQESICENTLSYHKYDWIPVSTAHSILESHDQLTTCSDSFKESVPKDDPIVTNRLRLNSVECDVDSIVPHELDDVVPHMKNMGNGLKTDPLMSTTAFVSAIDLYDNDRDNTTTTTIEQEKLHLPTSFNDSRGLNFEVQEDDHSDDDSSSNDDSIDLSELDDILPPMVGRESRGKDCALSLSAFESARDFCDSERDRSSANFRHFTENGAGSSESISDAFFFSPEKIRESNYFSSSKMPSAPFLENADKQGSVTDHANTKKTSLAEREQPHLPTSFNDSRELNFEIHENTDSDDDSRSNGDDSIEGSSNDDDSIELSELDDVLPPMVRRESRGKDYAQSLSAFESARDFCDSERDRSSASFRHFSENGAGSSESINDAYFFSPEKIRESNYFSLSKMPSDLFLADVDNQGSVTECDDSPPPLVDGINFSYFKPIGNLLLNFGIGVKARLALSSSLPIPEPEDLRMEDLNRLKILGEGQFGQVWLVTDKQRNTYALKLFAKYAHMRSNYLQNMT